MNTSKTGIETLDSNNKLKPSCCIAVKLNDSEGCIVVVNYTNRNELTDNLTTIAVATATDMDITNEKEYLFETYKKFKRENKIKVANDKDKYLSYRDHT